MKILCLIKHAHAEKMSNKSDYARLLTNRGKSEAKALGKNLKRESGSVYEKIISSPAMRAFETSLIISDRIGIDKSNIDLKESLYGITDIKVILDIINSLDDTYNKVLMVGHDPAIEEIGKKMIPGFKQKFYTCSALQIEFDFDSWSGVKENSGRFSFYKFNRYNPDISELDEALTNAMKKEIFLKIENSVKDVETNLISGHIKDNLDKGKKLAKHIFRSTDIMTVRSLALLDQEMHKYEESKKKKREDKLQKIEMKLTKENKETKIKENRKLEKLEQKKKKLEEKLGITNQNEKAD